MLKFIKGLFGGRAKNPSPAGATAPAPASVVPTNKDDPRFERIAREELTDCNLIRDDAFDAVLMHLLGKKRLFATKTPLSVEEKRRLGINTRLKITEELVAFLNDEGLKSHYPAEIIPNIERASTFRYSRIKDVERMRGLGLKRVTFRGVKGIDHCAWCNKVDGKKFDLSEDLDQVIKLNCTCDPYWMGYLEAEI